MILQAVTQLLFPDLQALHDEVRLLSLRVAMVERTAEEWRARALAAEARPAVPEELATALEELGEGWRYRTFAIARVEQLLAVWHRVKGEWR